MILSTTPQIEGHPIREYKGVVTGEVIIGANVLKDFMAGLTDFFGGQWLDAHGGHQRNSRCHLI